MVNLLTETKACIENNDRLLDEVVLVGSRDGEYGCTWEEFAELADEEYDDGFGSAWVACDLIVWFADGSYLRRAEYDGSEWWEYITTKAVPTPKKPLNYVIGRYGPSVADLHADDELSDFFRNP